MRIARLHMDAQDKTRFEIQGKSSVKYHLKANHVVEAKRWFWALNNAIQWAKDEAREDDKRRTRDAEALRQAKIEQSEKQATESQADTASVTSGKGISKNTSIPASLGVPGNFGPRLGSQNSRGASDSGLGEEDGNFATSNDPNYPPSEINRVTSQVPTTAEGDPENDDYGDYASSGEVQPSNKDAFNITAQSVKLQLDLLGNVASALQAEKARDPMTPISHASVEQALNTYEGAVSSLNSLVIDLLKISRDRDAYWQYRLDREADTRKLWEDSMARVAQEHEELQSRIGESEEKRKRTKKALKEALENASTATSGPISRDQSQVKLTDAMQAVPETEAEQSSVKDNQEPPRKKSVIKEFANITDNESDEEDEFFDAVDAGEVEILTSPPEEEIKPTESSVDLRAVKHKEIVPSFKGYEDPIRKRLKMDADDRPKISLWVRS